MEIVVQGLGAIGFFFGVVAFQSNKHRTMVVCRILNEIFFGIQFILLGAYTGAVMNGLSCLRNAIFIRNVEKGRSNKPWVAVFIVIIMLYGILSWNSFLSLVPIIAKIFTTLAYSIKDTSKVRLLNLPSCIGWLSYNAMFKSVFGVVNEGFSLISILVGIYRYDIKGEKDKEKE